mmetsp:Transcript_28121/g.62947  ORF Transcript_28121/g.62947 Transcript_28121/m.62947 type:complete len:258 (+) Transcript_28121:263-1036(+)
MMSIYTFLGALQAAIWFFFVPHLCKYIWPRLFGPHQADRLTGLAELCLWCGLLPYFVLYLVFVALPPYYLNWHFFERYKISNKEWPWRSGSREVRDRFWKSARRSLMLDVLYLSVGIPILAWIKIIAFGSISFDTGDDWPTYSESANQIMSYVVLHELMFYWIHRAFHKFPSLYRFHKTHHEYKQNNILASQHFSLVDFFFSIALPSIACTIIVRPHSVCHFQAGLWLFTANLDDHLGYVSVVSSALVSFRSNNRSP